MPTAAPWSCAAVRAELEATTRSTQTAAWLVQRVWARAGLQAHRLERYGTSPDPDFERKASAILGLCLRPPAHSAVFCGDEKTAIQAVAFLDQVVTTQPTRRAIHVIGDNLSAHETQRTRDWLARHPRVTMHYTPTHSSWLNQVELWFAKIERDCIARGIVTSRADLHRTLMQYIRLHNKTCRPVHWTYRSPNHRIRASGDWATVH